MRVLILALVWALAGSLPQQGPPRDQPAQREASATASGAISGRVYAADTGTPIRGATVALTLAVELDRGAPAVSQLPYFMGRADRGPIAITDAFGRFRMNSVPAGTYRMVVMPAGYRGKYLPMGYGAVRANDAGRPLIIRGGEEIRNADVGLTTGVAIEGRVVDETGEPLSRIPVFAARLSVASESAERVSDLAIITDDLGRYRVYGLEPGTYIVGADGHYVTPLFASFEGSRAAAWGPVGPREPDSFSTTYYPSATTDATAQPVRIGAQDVTGIDIVLRRAERFPLSGTILDSQGTPAASTRLVLVRGRSSIVTNLPVATDANGRFHFPLLEADTYRLLVGSGLWPGLTSVNGRTEFADVPITVVAGPVDLTVTTQPGIGLAGRIVFAEGPPSSPLPLKIAFRRPERAAATMEIPATMGDEGLFFGSDVFGPVIVRVSSLPPGWLVKAVTLAGADITDVPTVFTRQHDGQLQILLTSRGSAVEGELKGQETGLPIDATVYVFSEDRTSWSLSSPRTIRSDVQSNGRFSVTGLAAGRYYAIAIARAGFRIPQNPGVPFFELLSKDATPFVIGDDERRTVDLRLWRWPE